MREDWEDCIISDVSEVLNGDRGKNYPSSAHYINNGIPFVSAGNIGENNKLNKELNFISEDRFELLKAGKLQKGDIVYCIRGSIGKFAFINFDQGAIASSLCIIRSNTIIDRNYFCNYLASPLCSFEINRFDNGTAQPNLSAKDFKQFKLPLAPIPIQRAIVLKIENLFASLDKGIADLKTAQEQLKVYRQAVLKKAFEGGFTNKNVKEGELPEGWQWITFNDVCLKIGDIDHKMPKQVESGGFPYISTKDFTDDLKISFENAKFISEVDFQNLAKKIKPEKGDIIFPRYGTIGKNIFVDFEKDFLVSYSCAVVKPNHNKIDSKYLFYFSLSPVIKDEIKKYVVETTQANIGIASIKRFVFPLPKDKSEQHSIVREIESRLSVCDKMEQSISEALEKAEALRQSILKKAFEGKLLSDAEITKCKQEADYEPASELLKKIKAEKK